MKLNKFALTLTAAALLPTLAYAATDEVAASFERDLQRSITTEPIVAVAKAWSDPLDIVNHTLNEETDAVVASFDRDLYRKPVNFPATIASATDPLTEAIKVALYGTTDQVVASFERDLRRIPTTTSGTLLAGEADPLRAINVALWNDLGDKPVAHAAIAGSHRHGG